MSVTLRQSPPAPGSNVVPMPTAPPTGLWPVPPVMPGCCPPGGMDALMKCYCDIQAATAFICAVMVDCINTNPAVTQAIISAIEASGSSLPLLGVTNGTDAQPGQVGEWVRLPQLNQSYTGAGLQSFTLTMGVLQPGDWTIWMWMGVSSQVISLQFTLNPLPAGFSDSLNSFNAVAAPGAELTLASGTGRATISVPSLVAVNVSINATTAGLYDLVFLARRAR